jgi:hypothetical protein
MRYAEDLAKDYDFETESEYFDYIIESYINGQPQQCKELFLQMAKDDQSKFLINYVNPNSGQIGKSVLNLCIKALIY